jgi:hypothetical protein
MGTYMDQEPRRRLTALIPTLNSSRKMNLRNVDLVTPERIGTLPTSGYFFHSAGTGWAR